MTVKLSLVAAFLMTMATLTFAASGLPAPDAELGGPQIEVASAAGQTFVKATPVTALDGSYPIARALYYYTNGNPKGAAKAFMDFVLSPEGQKLIQDVGYVPIKPVPQS